MMKRYVALLFLISILSLVIVGCIPEEEIQKTETCLPPLVENSFPVGETSFFGNEIDVQEPTAWTKLITLPENILLKDQYPFTVRLTEKGEEVWFTINYFDGEKLYYYQTWDGSLHAIQNVVSGFIKFVSAEDGNIWGLTYKGELYFFDPEKNDAVRDFQLINTLDQYELDDFLLRNDGKIWFLAKDKQSQFVIGLYDPTDDTIIVTTSEFEIKAPSLGPDDSLFVFDSEGGHRGGSALYMIDSNTLESKLIMLSFSNIRPWRWDSDQSIVDLQGRIWYNNQAMILVQEDGKFGGEFQVIEPTIFITTINRGGSFLNWPPAYPQAATEDGRIWFKSWRGVAWHQPETGQSCLFSRTQSNIVKSPLNNLYLLYKNSIYMLPEAETSSENFFGSQF